MQLEPDAFQHVPHAAPPGAIALVSIAISLKRIADAIEGDATHMGLANVIGQAIGDAIFGASQR